MRFPLAVAIRAMVTLFYTMIASCGTDSLPVPPPGAARIGYLGRFSGTNTPDYDRRLAAELAVEEITSAGGVRGAPLALVVRDTANDDATAESSARSLVDEDRVLAIVGPAKSSETIRVASAVAIPSGVVLVSPSATSPLVTNLVDQGLVWRTALSDSIQGAVAAELGRTKLQVSTASILHIGDAYGRGLSGSFRAQFEASGGRVLADVEYPSQSDYTSFDFGPSVSEALAPGPELLYLVTFANDGAKITRTLSVQITASASSKPILLGVDGNRKDGFLANADPAVVEGMYGTVQTVDREDPQAQRFLANFEARFGDPPTSGYASSNYDAVYLLAYALEAAGRIERGEVAPNLAQVSRGGHPVGVASWSDGRARLEAGEDIDYQGASGPVDFDDHGDVVSGTYVVWQIENGQFVDRQVVRYP